MQEIDRALDRLEFFFKQTNTPVRLLLAPFYYSAQLLLKYSEEADEISSQGEEYFSKFSQFMDEFARCNFQDLKLHETQIMDEIVEIVHQPSFLRFLKGHQKNGKQTSYIESMLEEDEDSSSIYANSFWSEISQTALKKQAPNSRVNRQQQYAKRRGKKNKKYEKNESPEQLVQKLREAYQDHRIDDAQTLRKKIKTKGYECSEKDQKLLKKVEFEYDRMIGFQGQFDKEGWKFEKEKEGIRIYSKVDEGDPIAGVKMEGIVNVPIENFLAIVAEPDLFSQYVPFCKDSRQLFRISRNQLIGRSTISIPFLKNRGMLFYSVGYDRMKTNGTFFIYSCTISEEQSMNRYSYEADPVPNQVKLDYKYFIVEYIPITLDRARVKIASKVDMHMNLIPQFIVKASALKFGYDYFYNILKINSRFSGSPWQEKMKKNPSVYEYFINKVAQHKIPSTEGQIIS